MGRNRPHIVLRTYKGACGHVGHHEGRYYHWEPPVQRVKACDECWVAKRQLVWLEAVDA